MTLCRIAAIGSNRRPSGSRHLPSHRLLAPDGPLAVAQARKSGQRKPSIRVGWSTFRFFRSLPVSGIIPGIREESSGKSRFMRSDKPAGKCPLKSFMPVAGLLVAALAMAGCTFAVPIEATRLPAPLVEPLPLTVGVYYDAEFRAYEHRQKIRGEVAEHTWTFSLGPPSVAYFDQVFASIFERAVPVQNRPSLPARRPEVAAIIEPSIETFHVRSPPHPGISAFPVPFGTYSATIGYRITLYSVQGDVIASWTVGGSGAIQHTFVSEGLAGIVKGIYSEVINAAMREAAGKFILAFRDQPEIRRWLKSIGLASHSLFD